MSWSESSPDDVHVQVDTANMRFECRGWEITGG